MFNYQNFDEVFSFNPEYSYTAVAVETIEANRRSLEGLFVDKVLKLLDIKRPSKYYPPRSNSDLRTLHQTVVAGNSADHTKLSLLYYILLDYDAISRRSLQAGLFEDKSFLPKRYQIFMKGLWHMDRREFNVALEYLTHSSLIPTFHEEILETFVRHSKPPDMSLPLAFYHTVQPTLKSRQAVESLFSAIAQTNVVEAFYFARGQADIPRRQMFESLISSVLSSPACDTTANRAAELVSLPFTQEEEDWFEGYLTTGDGKGLKRANDTLMMWKISSGRFKDALSGSITGGNVTHNLSWETIVSGLHEGLGPRP